MDTSPAAGIRSGDPFMLLRGVILTAQTARGPDGTLTETTHKKRQKYILCVTMKKMCMFKTKHPTLSFKALWFSPLSGH